MEGDLDRERYDFEDENSTYLLAELSSDGKSLLPLPCKPLPVWTLKGQKEHLNVNLNRRFDVFVHTVENKMWAIAQDDSGFVFFRNKNTKGCLVYSQVNNSKSKGVRSLEKLAKGYVKQLNDGLFDPIKFDLLF